MLKKIWLTGVELNLSNPEVSGVGLENGITTLQWSGTSNTDDVTRQGGLAVPLAADRISRILSFLGGIVSNSNGSTLE